MDNLAPRGADNRAPEACQGVTQGIVANPFQLAEKRPFLGRADPPNRGDLCQRYGAAGQPRLSFNGERWMVNGECRNTSTVSGTHQSPSNKKGQPSDGLPLTVSATTAPDFAESRESGADTGVLTACSLLSRDG